MRGLFLMSGTDMNEFTYTIAAVILVFITNMVAQQMRYQTACKDQDCTINAYNKDHINVGYIKLSGCHITYLNIFPQFEKKGFAKALLEQVRTQAALHDCTHVTLFSFKRLVNYYEKNGFTCDSQNCSHPI